MGQLGINWLESRIFLLKDFDLDRQEKADIASYYVALLDHTRNWNALFFIWTNDVERLRQGGDSDDGWVHQFTIRFEFFEAGPVATLYACRGDVGERLSNQCMTWSWCRTELEDLMDELVGLDHSEEDFTALLESLLAGKLGMTCLDERARRLVEGNETEEFRNKAAKLKFWSSPD